MFLLSTSYKHIIGIDLRVKCKSIHTMTYYFHELTADQFKYQIYKLFIVY